MSDGIEKELQAQVREASRRAQPLHIVGGASKDFYGASHGAFDGASGGRETGGTVLSTAPHKGVIGYDPAELVVTVRAGTRVADLEEVLAAKHQMLGFEPPQFSAATTIGGAVAAGLAGPRRPFAGAARDFVLGVKILNGNGELMSFGGEVMKNVAGFDIARLMAGALGTLGVLLEISLRVVPQPQKEKTLVLAHANLDDALALLNRLAGRPLPLSAAAWQDGETRIRLSASAAGVKSAAAVIGGEADSHGAKFWQQLRDHQLPFFHHQRPLLRVSLPPAANLPPPPGVAQLVDWGGAQRWIAGEADADAMRAAVAGHGGHVTRFRHCARHCARHAGNNDTRQEIFQPLAPALKTLHLRLKRAFDPGGILNPGRLYRDF